MSCYWPYGGDCHLVQRDAKAFGLNCRDAKAPEKSTWRGLNCSLMADNSKPMSLLFDEEGALFICDEKGQSILSRAPVLSSKGPMEEEPLIQVEGHRLKQLPHTPPRIRCANQQSRENMFTPVL